MSSRQLVPVQFELNVPGVLERRGYDRQRIQAVHVSGETVRHGQEDPVERVYETELPQDVAEGIAGVLRWQYSADRSPASGKSRMNCFVGAAAVKHWTSLDDHNLNINGMYLPMSVLPEEIEPVILDETSVLHTGGFYAVSRGVREGARIVLAHTGIAMREPNVHFGVSGPDGQPYIGDTVGMFNAYKGTEFYYVRERPSIIDADWEQRILNEHGRNSRGLLFVLLARRYAKDRSHGNFRSV